MIAAAIFLERVCKLPEDDDREHGRRVDGVTAPRRLRSGNGPAGQRAMMRLIASLRVAASRS